eukprot:scaffold250000_cov45-Prasinocladus_malaysianus.AAC.2
MPWHSHQGITNALACGSSQLWQGNAAISETVGARPHVLPQQPAGGGSYVSYGMYNAPHFQYSYSYQSHDQQAHPLHGGMTSMTANSPSEISSKSIPAATPGYSQNREQISAGGGVQCIAPQPAEPQPTAMTHQMQQQLSQLQQQQQLYLQWQGMGMGSIEASCAKLNGRNDCAMTKPSDEPNRKHHFRQNQRKHAVPESVKGAGSTADAKKRAEELKRKSQQRSKEAMAHCVIQ